MNERAILVKARSLIQDESRWYQNRYGLPATNPSNTIASPAFEKLCSFGAVCEAGKESFPVYTERAYRLLHRGMEYCPITFNDNHTHAEVLAGFDRAIALFDSKAAEDTARLANLASAGEKK